MKLKESETKLESMLESKPENDEVPAEEIDGVVIVEIQTSDANAENNNEPATEVNVNLDKTNNVKNVTDNSVINNNLKKVTNIENEQLNKSMHNIRTEEESHSQEEVNKPADAVLVVIESPQQLSEPPDNFETTEEDTENAEQVVNQSEIRKDDQELNHVLRKNILSCVEKITRIEEMKTKKKDSNKSGDQVFVCYCELWSVSLCCEPKYP